MHKFIVPMAALLFATPAAAADQWAVARTMSAEDYVYRVQTNQELRDTILEMCRQDWRQSKAGRERWLIGQLEASNAPRGVKIAITGICITYMAGMIDGLGEAKTLLEE